LERLVIVGPGRMGLALGYALVHADAVGSIVYQGRRSEPPSHPLFHQGLAEYRYGLERPAQGTTAVILTVPDPVLPEIANALAARGQAPEGCPVIHTSGVQGGEPLVALNRVGYRVGTLHPLQDIAHPITGADRLVGAGFAVSGEREALSVIRRIVDALGGRSLLIPTHRRPLYHAAGVLGSNYLVVLMSEALRLLMQAGVPEEDALPSLVALARGAVENVAELGFSTSLTGPIGRGDADTVDLHLRTLDPADASLYADLGRLTLERTRAALPPEVADQLETLFQRHS